jgi:hypothetical protein
MRALALVVLLATGPAAAAAEKHTVAVGDWSEPVDGLRGRLVVAQGRTLGDGNARESLVYVEFQNVAEAGERTLAFDPDRLKCELLDANGNPVPKTAPFGRSGGRPGKTLVTLPFDSTLRLRANPYGFGRADDLLVPLNADAWLIKAGDTADYFLTGTFTVPPVDRTGPGKPPWAGELKLPKARLARPAAAPKPVDVKDDPNPVFEGWNGFKPGTSVTIRQAQNSNGALTEALITHTLVEVGPDSLVLERHCSDVQRKHVERPARVEVPRRTRLTAADPEELAVPLVPARVYEEGTETVTISGTAYKARWYKYRGGAGGDTYEGRKLLLADVPGHLLKTEVTVKRPMHTTVFTIEVVEIKRP